MATPNPGMVQTPQKIESMPTNIYLLISTLSLAGLYFVGQKNREVQRRDKVKITAWALLMAPLGVIFFSSIEHFLSRSSWVPDRFQGYGLVVGTVILLILSGLRLLWQRRKGRGVLNCSHKNKANKSADLF